MTPVKRYTVSVTPRLNGWLIQSHRIDGAEVVDGYPYERESISDAISVANELVKHRLAAGRSCVLVLSDEAQAASN